MDPTGGPQTMTRIACQGGQAKRVQGSNAPNIDPQLLLMRLAMFSEVPPFLHEFQAIAVSPRGVCVSGHAHWVSL